MLSYTKSCKAGKTLSKILFFLVLLTQIALPQWVQTNETFGSVVACFTTSDTNLFAGGNGGVFLSTNNGTSWTAVNSGLTDTLVSALGISGVNLFAGTWRGGVFLSTNSGTNWTPVNSGLTATIVYSFAISGTHLFAGTSGGVFLSTNSGTNWTPVNSGLTATIVYSFAVSGTHLFAGTSGGVFLSTNNGTSWTAVNSGLTDTLVSALGISGVNLFAGTWRGGVFLSTNSGTNWTEANSGLPVVSVMALAVSDTNLFVGYLYYGVFLSTNYGASWTAVNAGLTNAFVFALVVSGTNLVAGTEYFGIGGVWRRPLAGMVPVELTSFTATTSGKEVTLNWSTATELNNQGFEVQRKFGSNDFVTVGSVKGNVTTTSPNHYLYVDKLIDGGKYFYRLKQIDYGGKYEYSNEIEVDIRTVDNFTLEQNYPNPFNPTTTIGYVLQEKSNTKLALLNALGEEITMLVNEEQDKGYHKVEFNGSKLSSGVYFYQLRARNFIDTKKMILLR